MLECFGLHLALATTTTTTTTTTTRHHHQASHFPRGHLYLTAVQTVHPIAIQSMSHAQIRIQASPCQRGHSASQLFGCLQLFPFTNLPPFSAAGLVSVGAYPIMRDVRGTFVRWHCHKWKLVSAGLSV